MICKISTYFGSGTPVSQKQLLTSLLLSALTERAEWCLWLRRKWTHNIIPELGLRPGSEVGMILCQLKGVLETKKELEQLCKRICHRITLCACLSQCIPAANTFFFTEDLGANPIIMLSSPIIPQLSDLPGPSIQTLYVNPHLAFLILGPQAVFCNRPSSVAARNSPMYVNGCTCVSAPR